MPAINANLFWENMQQWSRKCKLWRRKEREREKEGTCEYDIASGKKGGVFKALKGACEA
jgi:hypothetical protein